MIVYVGTRVAVPNDGQDLLDRGFLVRVCMCVCEREKERKERERVAAYGGKQ